MKKLVFLLIFAVMFAPEAVHAAGFVTVPVGGGTLYPLPECDRRFLPWWERWFSEPPAICAGWGGDRTISLWGGEEIYLTGGERLYKNHLYYEVGCVAGPFGVWQCRWWILASEVKLTDTSGVVVPTPTPPSTLEGRRVLITQRGLWNPYCVMRGFVGVKASPWSCTDQMHARTPSEGVGFITRNTEGSFLENGFYRICLESDPARCGWYDPSAFQILN